MAGWIIVCILAAFGVLSALWVLFGSMLSGLRGSVTVHFCRGSDEEAVVRRYRWLRDMGVAGGCLLLVDSELSEVERTALCERDGSVVFCTWAELPARLEQERERI